jgi:hypothetical protein
MARRQGAAISDVHAFMREGVAPLGAPSRCFFSCRAALPAGSPPLASSWRGVLVPPGGAPAPPERKVTSLARGHRTSPALVCVS